MPHTYIDGPPGLKDSHGTFSLRTRALSAVINSPRFIAGLTLEPSQLNWVFERPPVQINKTTWSLPRRISICGSNLWYSATDDVVAELLRNEDGGALVSARKATTGQFLWECVIRIPEAADWAEPSPAWPGATTEEIDAFLASDPTRLVVCMSRQSRRSRMYSAEITVDTMPSYSCQLDAMCLDVSIGAILWKATFRDVAVGILERRGFSGMWSGSQRVGVLDFESGTNRVFYEAPHALGWPIRDGSEVAVPWYSAGEVGVTWLDEFGKPARQASWRQKKVNAINLHSTGAGLAMQINDQALYWLATENYSLWNVRAKPYIYRVHSCPSADVFVGTDGRGGRLFAFDPVSGEETLNLKPPFGGVGTLAKVPDHDVLVARLFSSRSDIFSGSLLVLSMQDRSHRLDCQCRELLGTWQHGAVCVSQDGERLAIVDIR